MASFLHSKRSLLCLLVLILAISLDGCSSWSGEDDQVYAYDNSSLMVGRFQLWKAAYNRTYATAAEERRRFSVYAGNMRYIEARNSRGASSYQLGEHGWKNSYQCRSHRPSVPGAVTGTDLPALTCPI
ncbi:unnamed protein product [Urochloa humidicola]